MGYLNGVLTLHDIRDVEAFCNDIIRRRNLNLTAHEHEDLIAYLVEEAWILSTRYRQGGISFSTYAGNTLRSRLVDHIRTRDGRTIWRTATGTYERELPDLLSLDADREGVGPLHRSLPSPDRDPDAVPQLLAERGRLRARHKQALRQGLLGQVAA